jgi:hypothetical protein
MNSSLELVAIYKTISLPIAIIPTRYPANLVAKSYETLMRIY